MPRIFHPPYWVLWPRTRYDARQLFDDQDHLHYNVPGDCNSLYWATVLGFLIPVKNADFEFVRRYKRLFGISDGLPQVQGLIQNYDVSLISGAIYRDKTLKKLIKKLRNQLLQYMNDNISKFVAFTIVNETYIERSKRDGFWVGDPEVQAISFMIGSRVNVRSPSGELNTFHPDNMISSTIQLFYVSKRVGRNDSKHYNFIVPQDGFTVSRFRDNSNIITAESLSHPSSVRSGPRPFVPPEKELVEEFLGDNITDRFVDQVQQLLLGLPEKHVSPSYDEFLIYGFFGSAVTLPDHIMMKFDIYDIHFDVNLNGEYKFIRLIFEIGRYEQCRRLIFRTIVVTSNATIPDGLNAFLTQYSNDDYIREIGRRVDLDATYNVTDAKILFVKLAKNKRSFEIIEDEHLKEAVERIRELSLFKPTNYQDQFGSMGYGRTWFPMAMAMNIALEKLCNKRSDDVEKGVYELFQIFIKTCRKHYEHFLTDEQKGKGAHYNESRFHGFIYGALMLNFKELYHINCFAERRSGRGGGADLILTSHSDEYSNRNLNAIPIIVELKVDKDAEIEALPKAQENVLSCLTSFSKNAVIAGVSLFTIDKGLRKKWSPLKVKTVNIPYPGNFLLHLLNQINVPDRSNISQSIRRELEYLYHTIPAIDRIPHHPNYLSRLILGQVLAISCKFKFVFMYEDKNVGDKVSTFLLQEDGTNKILLLNIIELDKSDTDFQVDKAIPLYCHTNLDVCQIDIKINVQGDRFLKVNDSEVTKKSYLQNVKVSFNEDQSLKDLYRGQFQSLGNVNIICRDEDDKLKLVDTKNLSAILGEALFPIRNLIIHETIKKKANINVQAILQGLIMGEQNTAKNKHQLIKVLSETDIALNQIANLAVSIADDDENVCTENEAILISRKVEGAGDNKLAPCYLNTLFDKKVVKSYTIDFDFEANNGENLIRIDNEEICMPRSSRPTNLQNGVCFDILSRSNFGLLDTNKPHLPQIMHR